MHNNDAALENRLIGIRYGHWLSGKVQDATGWKLVGVHVHNGVAWIGHNGDAYTCDAVRLAEEWRKLDATATYQEIIGPATKVTH